MWILAGSVISLLQGDCMHSLTVVVVVMVVILVVAVLLVVVLAIVK